MNKSKTYCVMPHIGMAIQNESDFCCCNLNKESWKNNKQEVMHADSTSVASTFASHTRKIIAAALDHGIQHASCQSCWHAESVGNQSARQQFNRLFSDIDALPDQPRVLIIKPGNTCNFACRMCNPETSTSWYQDGYNLENLNIPFREYTQKFETIRNSFDSDHEKFWQPLHQWIENFVFIDIYGGEPFLSPAMFELLNSAVVSGAAKNIELQLHTNASIFNKQYLEILRHYKKVEFRVSIDSHVPAHLEYIRHKSKFDTVIENTNKFKQFADRYPSIHLGITNTITPFNVHNVDLINQQLSQLTRIVPGVNMVTTPEYDIRHMPIPVKQYLIQHTKNSTVKNFLKTSIPGCEVEWPKFCKITDRLDQLRGQSFSNTFPEWWNILKPHWVSSTL